MTETNIGRLISAAVTARLTPEFIEKEVITRTDKLVIEAVNSALRGYSDTAKLIEKAVHDALRVDRLDLPSYGEAVAQILRAQIEAKVSDLIAGQLATDMDDLLSLAPKTIKLSEIANIMRKKHENDDGYGEVITCCVERTDYGSIMVYLDEDHHYETESEARRKAQICLHLGKDGRALSTTIKGRDSKSTTFLGRFYGMDQMVRAFHACGTIIELDEADVVISVGDY